MKNIMEKRITDKEFYMHMKEVHGTKCRICGLSPVVYHHLIPLCDGGDNKDGNIIPLCKSCHKKVHGCIDRKGYTDKGGTGRKVKRAENWQEILLLWAHSEIGTADAKSKLGISQKSHITDKKWVKEYLQSIGVEKVHNTVDVKESKKKEILKTGVSGIFVFNSRHDGGIGWKKIS